MRNVPIPPERLQDPLAHTLHPNLSRDPERTPMQWERGPGAGFTTGEPWLPLARTPTSGTWPRSASDPRSLLQLYRELLALRRAHPALHAGAFRRLAGAGRRLRLRAPRRRERALVALELRRRAARRSRFETGRSGARSRRTPSGRRPPARAHAARRRGRRRARPRVDGSGPSDRAASVEQGAPMTA